MTEKQPRTTSEIEAQLALHAAKRRLMLCESIPAWPERVALLLSLIFIIVLVDAPKNDQLSRILVSGSFMGVMICLWIIMNKLRQKVEELSRLATETGKEVNTAQKQSNA